MVFKKRIPEPKEMGEVEQDVFEKMSMESYERWLLPLVDDFLGELGQKKGVVLDVGSGPGFLVAEIACRSKFFDVVGVDVSDYALKLARKNCKGLRNVRIRKGNVSKLPFRDDSFDAVICKDSLHHFDGGLEKALREMLRVLRKSGLLYIQDVRRDLPRYLLERACPPDTVLKKLQYYSARASYTKDEVEFVAKKVGLGSVRIFTRRLSKVLRSKYKRRGIDLDRLKESFQVRYVLVGRKR